MLLSTHQLSKSYGTQILFQQLDFSIHEGERIGLIGPNGAGKSSLLKILAGLDTADEGRVCYRNGMRIGYSSQSPEFPPICLEQLLLHAPGSGSEAERLTRARVLLGKAQFQDPQQLASTLSGGWKKRLDIVRALMNEPSLLLLDEPTNHLDLEGIEWLEQFLLREKRSLLIVSHDRYFLSKVCNKTVELNRCYPEGLFVCGGGIEQFYRDRDSFLQGQIEQERSLAGVVRNELDWLRRSPKARTSKSRSRIERAHEMIEDLEQIKRRNQLPRVEIDFNASQRQTRNLLVGTRLTKSIGSKLLFKGLDIKLSPGSRLGIVGSNGTGKTTLLKVLASQLSYDGGTLKYAEGLKLVYFDQHREQIPPHLSLREALCPNGEMVTYQGQQIHVHGWAKRFLFAQEKLQLPVQYLSGGERARILIARLMLEPADILFLDEPTNDLDIPTLEVLEQSLNEFAGAVVLICHDRCLMDRVCTQVLSLGEQPQYFADYSQCQRAVAEKQSSLNRLRSCPVEHPPLPQAAGRISSHKLSYKEQRELAGMEQAIVALEQQIEQIEQQLAEVDASSRKASELYREIGVAQSKLELLFQRWQELEARS